VVWSWPIGTVAPPCRGLRSQRSSARRLGVRLAGTLRTAPGGGIPRRWEARWDLGAACRSGGRVWSCPPDDVVRTQPGCASGRRSPRRWATPGVPGSPPEQRPAA
jgi:hypothetical protein